MTCREFADFLADYFAEELPACRLDSFEHHLAICMNCQRYLAQYRDTVALGRVSFADLDAAVPDDVPAHLIAAILAARR